MAITESVLFDGKVFSRKIDEETLGLSRRFYDIRGRKPRLAIIDPAQTSENSIYAQNKSHPAGFSAQRVKKQRSVSK